MQIALNPGTRTTANLAGLLTGLDALAGLGVRADHPKLKPARKAAERVGQLHRQNTAIRAQWDRGAEEAMTRLAADYARGDIDAEHLADHVGSIAAMRDKGSKSTLHTVLTRAEAAAAAPGIEGCRKLGDTWVTEILRPAVERVPPPVQASSSSGAADDRP